MLELQLGAWTAVRLDLLRLISSQRDEGANRAINDGGYSIYQVVGQP